MSAFRIALTAVFALGSAQIATAEPATVVTPSPVIHLEDNLDEADGLGWCIDTVGRGFSAFLHAHSCKPQGGDVQFGYDKATQTIRSATFENHCLSNLPSDARTTFGLVECDVNDPQQRIVHDPMSMTFRDADDPGRCLAVGESSRTAGPYMSRDLVWADCTESDPLLRRWVVKD